MSDAGCALTVFDRALCSACRGPSGPCNRPVAITALQILAIDLLGELLPIAAVGRDPEQGRVMSQPPRDPKSAHPQRRRIRDLLYAGSFIGALAIANFLLFFG